LNDKSHSLVKKSIIQNFFADDRRFLLIILLPVTLFFLVWNVVPTLWMIGLSFHNYSLLSAQPAAFIGLDNFVDLATSNEIWAAFGRTFLFVVVGVGIQTLLGIKLGFLFWNSKNMPGRRIALTLLFAPMMIAPVAAGNYFRLMLNPSFGIINYIVSLFNDGYTIEFLTSSEFAFGTVLAVDIWMWTPFMILMTLAALGAVPKAELEAANVDRLTLIQKLRHIIWPHGKFILMLGILLRTIQSIQTMDLVFLLTGGGPGAITELIGILIHRVAFNSMHLGRASSIALFMLMVAIAFTSIYLFVLKSKNKEEL